MKLHVLFIFAIMVFMTSCNNKSSETPDQWSEEKLAEWYSEGKWKHGFDATPDGSVNQREMAIRYDRDTELWEKAFTFLAEENLEALDTGRHEIEGTDLFVMVNEYIPKDVDSVQFEAHRAYADIQYVVSGQEQISVVPIDETIITTPYNEEKDIMFMEAIEANDRIATPEKFFVFFPNDAHRPSVKANPDDSTRVKKIVVKVKLNGLPMDDDQ